ncbi:MAG: hypothetical protein WAT70_12940 [Rhizobiaceae bacterium]
MSTAEDSTLPAASVEDALARILASETFSRSERARDLLAYVVRATLSGQADRLKGFTIAMDVLGKDAAFDASTDAVVRVQAGRLRELLQVYYRGEGANDRVRIHIPRGTYQPGFETIEPADAGIVPPEPASEPSINAERISETIGAHFDTIRRVAKSPPGNRLEGAMAPTGILHSIHRHIRLFWAGLSVVIVMLAFVTWRVAPVPPGDQASAELATSGVPDRGIRGAATGQLLPSLAMGEPVSDDYGARSVRASLQGVLAAFDTVMFVTGQKAVDRTDFSIVVLSGPSSRHGLVQVVHNDTGNVLMSRTVDSANPDALAGLATSIAALPGVAYASVGENRLRTCLAAYEAFDRERSEESREKARDCLGVLAAGGAKTPIVWSGLSDLALRGPGTDMALAYARRGLALSAVSAHALSAEAMAMVKGGTAEEGARRARQAIEANPADLTVAATSGLAIALSGSWQEAVTILSRATRHAVVHPDWWDMAHFTALLMAERREEAGLVGGTFAGSGKPEQLAAGLIAANIRGDAARMATLLERIRSDHPALLADPAAAFAALDYPDGVAAALGRELQAAFTAGAS